MDEKLNFILECQEKRMTCFEIGILLGISKQRVSAILARARAKKIVKPVDQLKNWTRRKRQHLGLPLDIGKTNGGLDFVRELVRKRDKDTCQKCLVKWKIGKRKLDVHHLDIEMESKKDIKYDRENMDKLITLCHKCHLNLHTVRKKMSKKKKKSSYPQLK